MKCRSTTAYLFLIVLSIWIGGCRGSLQQSPTPTTQALSIPMPAETEAPPPRATPETTTRPTQTATVPTPTPPREETADPEPAPPATDEAGVATGPDPDARPTAAGDAASPGRTTSPGDPFSPGGVVSAIRPPLLVDGERGRLYAQAQVNGQPGAVALSTVDGSLLTFFPYSGPQALDREENRLIVDSGTDGIAVVGAAEGEVQRVIEALPPTEDPVTPQVDAQTGLVFAFRDTEIFVLDPDSGQVLRTASTAVERLVCGDLQGHAAIVGSEYDLVTRRLYLSFISYACTPWAGVTIVAYDADSLAELGRHSAVVRHQFVPFLGSLFGTSASRLGPTSSWAWNVQQGAWYQEANETDSPGETLTLGGMVADWQRQLIYEGLGSEIRIVDPATRQVRNRREVSLLQGDGRLVAHDPHSDNLYFLTGSGRLHIWPAQNLFAEAEEPSPAPSALPSRPVRSLHLAPDWPDDSTVVGLWDNGDCPNEGNLLFLLRGAQEAWQRLPVSGNDGCEALGAVAFSPAYAQDHMIFAAASDSGQVFRSDDGGRSWQAAGQPLTPDTAFRDLLVSSGFAGDSTLFAHQANGSLFRSRDGGQSWQRQEHSFDVVSISPEFGQDQTLMGSAGDTLWRSDDGGDSWRAVGTTPEGQDLVLLQLAPLFQKWQALFAFSRGGTFYRSLDGGESWNPIMSTSYRPPLQLAIAPDVEVGRPLFLLNGSEVEASYDGGDSIWSTSIRWPPSPTTLAISPHFGSDGRIFVGMADGQVISVDAARP